MANASDFLANVNFGMPSWDLFIAIFFIAAVVLYGLTLGKERILIILASIYMAFAIADNLPFITDEISHKFGLGPAFILRLVVFAVAIVAIFMAFTRMGLLENFTPRVSLPLIVVLSILHTGLLVTIVLSFVPGDAIQALSPTTRMLFTSDLFKFVWFIVPIGALFVVTREVKEN